MSDPSLPEESIFAQALEIESAGERAAFLDRACGDNPALRAEVESLLRVSGRSGDLLDLPEDSAVTADLPRSEGAGAVVGPYKLLEQIGEGGMGTVWMAEQTEPIQRRVAVKVIKEGMDSRQVLARFEAERQALALMDHPNIAKVLDAGKTPSGRPYFVMELVKGQPITKYCDEKRLGVRQRLELFADACRAVQHAHQKGIIHRDIKPSNVLVAPYDGRPVAVVPASKTWAMLGWSISASAWRSASKRAITCRVSMPSLMIFRATRRTTGRSCSAMKTAPKPPSPICWRSL